jgi:hypothetical protein
MRGTTYLISSESVMSGGVVIDGGGDKQEPYEGSINTRLSNVPLFHEVEVRIKKMFSFPA